MFSPLSDFYIWLSLNYRSLGHWLHRRSLTLTWYYSYLLQFLTMSLSDCFDRWSQTVTTYCEESACEEAGYGQVSVWTLLWNAQEKGSDAGHPVQNGKDFKCTLYIQYIVCIMYIIQYVVHLYVLTVAIKYYHLSLSSILNCNQQLTIMYLHSIRTYASSHQRNIMREIW